MDTITTNELKSLWNEAVKSTLNEVKKYDGVIPDKDVMDYMVTTISAKLSYKIKNNEEARSNR